MFQIKNVTKSQELLKENQLNQQYVTKHEITNILTISTDRVHLKYISNRASAGI